MKKPTGRKTPRKTRKRAGATAEAHERVIERPDGFYWQTVDGKQEYGPFDSLVAALEDMDYTPDSDYEPGETLEEAESELGISGWVDPETGELAEEERPRLEDH